MYNNLYDDGLENEITRKIIKDLWLQHADNVNFDLTTGRLYADPNDPENDWNQIDLKSIDPYLDKSIIDIMPEYKRKEYQNFLQENDKAGFDHFNKMYGNILAPVPEVEPKPELRPYAQVDNNSTPLNNIKIANSDISSFVPDERLLLTGLIEIQNEVSRQNNEIYKKKIQKYAPIPNEEQAPTQPQQPIQEPAPSVLTGSVTQVENRNPHPIRSKITQGARNTARFFLPKPIENWYLGSKEDEDFLRKNQNNTPTYEQLNNDYKNGVISKEEFTSGIQQRSKLNRIQADREYTDTRNLDIGKGVAEFATIGIGGPASASRVVAKVLPKVLNKATRKVIGNTVVNSAVDIATSVTTDKILDPDATISGSASQNTGKKLGKNLFEQILKTKFKVK